jgi:tetratricopeptide (TPR) repeat protein
MQIWSAEIKELESLYTSLKGQFPDLEKELEQLTETKDANVILIYSRRCLEVIITDLCENELKRPRKTEPLKGIIDKLSHEEKVPSHIIVSMHYLNSLSTFGAHPKDFDPEQIKPVLSNLVIIIKWYLKYKTEKAEEKERYKVQDTTGYKVQGAGYKVQDMYSQDGRPSEIDSNIGSYKEADHFSRSWKRPFIIVSGILISVIILYIVFDQFNFFRKDKFQDIRDPEGKISIAVMPFENLTGDTTLNWFQRGISSLIINGLGNSSELAVCDDQTLFEVMESMNQVYTAGISPSLAKEIAKKVKAETYISGSFQGREDTYWVLVNLVNSISGKIIWTNKVEGNLKSSGYLILADSLCNEIRNYLEIKALEDIADYEFREVYPNSAEAYRYFIEGMNLVLNQNFESGTQLLKKALEIDSTFTFASFYLAYAYNFNNQFEEGNVYLKKAYLNKNRIPSKYQLWLEMWYACLGENIQDITRYCGLLEESGINTRLLWFDLGVTYCAFAHQYEKAVAAFDKVIEINLERSSDWKFKLFYTQYGLALHKVGNHKKEKEIYNIGLSFFPDDKQILYNQAICELSFGGNTAEADEYLVKLISIYKGENSSESTIEDNLGDIYLEANILNKAEEHYRNAFKMEPDNLARMGQLAYFLIKYDINLDEGIGLVQKGLEIDPDRSYLLASKGLVYYKQGKYDEALELYRRVEEKLNGFNYNLYQLIQEAEQALANKNK